MTAEHTAENDAPACECPTDDYCPKCHPRWYANWQERQRYEARVIPPAENWNPNTAGPDCDWCGECEWCQNLGRVIPPAKTEGDQ